MVGHLSGTACASSVCCPRQMFFQMIAARHVTVDSATAHAFNKDRVASTYRERFDVQAIRSWCADRRVRVAGAVAGEQLCVLLLRLVPLCHKEPAPVCPPPVAACNVCPQQVSYVPQTCYRTEYTCVPCTSYRPVTTCDPCAGAQTVMQPVTTYVRRAVQVPYTTYRPVVQQIAPAAPCATCGNANYYSPVAAPAAMPTAGCSTCGGGAAAVSYTTPAAVGAPAATYGAPAASYGAPDVYAGAVDRHALEFHRHADVGPDAEQLGTLRRSNRTARTISLRISRTARPSSRTARPCRKIIPRCGRFSRFSPIRYAEHRFEDQSQQRAPLLQDPSNRTTSSPLMGPAVVARAIFRTADLPNIVRPAVMEGSGWSTAPKADDGWRSAKAAKSQTLSQATPNPLTPCRTSSRSAPVRQSGPP